jgi:hypothetical protein
LFWYNSEGNLHSFNDNPSRISWNDKQIFIDWHKNGEFFRKNSKYNRIIIEDKEIYCFVTNKYINKGISIQFELYNKKQQLHSFDGMPAIINGSCVEWYWNGKNCRNYFSNELPSSINQFGHIKFQRNNEDFPESVNFPLSRIHYGAIILKDLRNYEKYVNWPIRDLFTL